jgi:hypothetical protein
LQYARYKPIAKALGVKAETLMRWCRTSRVTKRAKILGRVILSRTSSA